MRSPSKVILATFGSLGDLHPFLALGRALAARNVCVRLAGAVEYRDKSERAGLAFHPMPPSIAQLERVQAASGEEFVERLLHDRAFILRELVMPYVRGAYEEMSAVVAGADCVVTSSLAFGARFAAERARIPVIPVVLQPFLFFSAYDPPAIPGASALNLLLAHVPRPARAAIFALLKRAARTTIAPLETMRTELGLAPARRAALFEDMLRPAGAIALYSPLLGAVQPDFPAGSTIAGFSFFDSEDGASVELERSLEAFLQAGAPPLVFTLGSVLVREPGAFFRESRAASCTLGQRAVLLVGPERLEAARAELASQDVYVGAYAPYSSLLPRAAAVVHHGGIGTLAQALRAGRPQLIVPHFADQPDNAARAARLGVARVLTPARYRHQRVARTLGRLVRDRAAAASALGVREQLLEEDGAALAARLILERIERRPLWQAREMV